MMTDKKAIVTLNKIRFLLQGMAQADEYAEALDVAKNAIRKQPEKISRPPYCLEEHEG